ncbi:MAG: hypothetical protein ABS35_02790 [Kaistia sp. SCN 65-12]|nr:MAG: hypothetical protein ABS35_02790 [Kaistia sp. SCN 65-12]
MTGNVRTICGRHSSVSIMERSSPAWKIAAVVKLTRSIASVGGRLRLSSVKKENMPPPMRAAGKAARAAA